MGQERIRTGKLTLIDVKHYPTLNKVCDIIEKEGEDSPFSSGDYRTGDFVEFKSSLKGARRRQSIFLQVIVGEEDLVSSGLQNLREGLENATVKAKQGSWLGTR